MNYYDDYYIYDNVDDVSVEYIPEWPSKSNFQILRVILLSILKLETKKPYSCTDIKLIYD